MTFNRVFNFEKNRSLNNLPQMGNTLNGWEIPITLTRVTQKIIEGDKVETKENINFYGVIDVLRDEELQLKPEGQRSWSWYRIYTKSNIVNLNTNDKIIWQNTQYQVMGIKNYSLYGYVTYDIILDYQ